VTAVTQITMKQNKQHIFSQNQPNHTQQSQE
jgi:hypothetical protein